MTSVLNVDTIADKAGTGPVALTKQHAAKAWCSYQMASSNAINGSFNVSSQVDTATGHSTIAWTNTMQDGYAAGGMSTDQVMLCANSGSSDAFNTALSASSGKFSAVSDGGSDGDRNVNVFAIHGDLA